MDKIDLSDRKAYCSFDFGLSNSSGPFFRFLSPIKAERFSSAELEKVILTFDAFVKKIFSNARRLIIQAKED